MRYAQRLWEELPKEFKEDYGNGLGAGWLPLKFRRRITKLASKLYNNESWRRHDFDYVVGHRERDRIIADLRFLKNMFFDGISHDNVMLTLLIPVTVCLSIFFFLVVLLGGWYKSFNYGERPKTKQEVLADTSWFIQD